MLLFTTSVSAQKLAFSYDASGNQTERRWTCLNCRTAQDLAAAKKMSIESGLDQQSLVTERVLKTYPNPLSESLNVSWQTPEKLFLKSIEIFGMTGNRVFNASFSAQDRETQISFNKFPPGTYLLIAKYSDSKTETIKLIKI